MRWLLLPSLLIALAGCGGEGVSRPEECDDTGACAAPREVVGMCEMAASKPGAPAAGEWCIEIHPDGSCTALVDGKRVTGALRTKICRALRP